MLLSALGGNCTSGEATTALRRYGPPRSRVLMFLPRHGLKPQQLHGSQLPDGLWDMAVTSDGEIAYTFGGRTGSYPDCTYYNTLYQINLSTMKCTELVPRSGSNPPMKACGSRMIYFSGKLVVYGGYTGRDWTDQLRVFDLRKGEFEW